MSRCCSAISASASSHARWSRPLPRGGAELAFGEPPFLTPGQRAEQRRKVGALQCLAQYVRMAGASHIVGNGSDEADAHAHGMKLEPGNERGHGTRHPPAVEHEYDRKAEGAGAIGRATRRIAGSRCRKAP